MLRFAQIASLFSLASVGFAGTPIPAIIPLAVTGYLGSCSVDDSSEYNSGGFLDVDGWHIKVPKNMLVKFPVVWTPFKGLCDAGITGYEISISGNVVNGVPIAGQIGVNAGLSLRGGQGYIDTINIVDGSMQIKGGPKLKISDPNGKFAKVNNAAPFFPVDDGNPSITAFSGYPMCLPRSDNDPQCPQSNRDPEATNFSPRDSLKMVPFRAGDFIEYAGLVNGGEVLAYEITAINVQVTTTASDTVPNYIRVEDAIVGINDAAANVEVADLRFIGFLSSCTGATVSIAAIEVDPCTGEENHRQIGSATPKAGDVRCKWEARLTNPKSPYTREYLITANNPVIETSDGIQAGQYVMPVSEWIQPEVNVPGTEPPPFRFADILGLVQGDFLDDQKFGPLSPFPGPDPPAPSKTCGPNDPTPSASPASDPVASAAAIAAVQRVGAQLFLVASNTAQGIPNSNLNFAWTKTTPASPSVSITNPTQPTATFIAPRVTTETSFTFEVTINLKSDSTRSSKTTVTVKVSPTAFDVVSLDTYNWESRQSGTIAVTCHSNVINGDNKKMELWLNNGASKLSMTNTGSPGKWSYSSRNVKQPTNVQCVSDGGGKSALVTAPFRRRKRGELGTALMSLEK